MGSRLLFPALLVLALAASAAFYWLSQDSQPREAAGPTAARGESAEGREAPAAELDAPDSIAPAASAADVGRTALQETAPVGASDEHVSRGHEADGPRIRGRVVDRDGHPIAGAEVLASDQIGFPLDMEEGLVPWMRRFETKTAEDGTFELEGPAAGTLRLGVRAPRFAPYDRSDIVLPADPEFELAPIVMSLGAILSGHVVDQNGQGIAGAELVRLQDTGGGFTLFGARRKPAAVSAADGSFRIDQLACGAWKVLVHTEANPDGVFEGLAEKPGVEVSGLRFTLAPGVEISGRVTGIPEDERGKLSVRAVEADGAFGPETPRTGEVDATGRFTVRGLEAGQEYDLRARRRADGGNRLTSFFGRSRSEEVRARAGRTDVVIPYQAEAAITFQVLDAASRLPITEFEVEAGLNWPMPLQGEDGEVLREHPDGLVRVGDLRPADRDERVRLVVRATGYKAYDRNDISIASGQELDLGAIYLEPVPVLRVTVLDAKTDEPVANAMVVLNEDRSAGGSVNFSRTVQIDTDDGYTEHVSGGGLHARTDADGVAEITSLEGKTCEVSVRAEGYARARETGLFLPEGRIVERTLRLTRGGSVQVTVVDSEGMPAAGAKVSHREPGGGDLPGMMVISGGSPQGDRVTDSEGLVLFENLAPGIHSFQVDEGSGGGFIAGEEMAFHIGGFDDESESWTEAQVEEGETTEITLRTSPRATLVGRVREAGKVLAGATLSLDEASKADDPMRGVMSMFGGGREVRTDGDGEYRFEGVKVGSYLLTVEHQTRRMAQEFEVEVRLGENEFDIDLSVAILEGRITDVDGEPFAGLEVSAERYQEGGGGPRPRGMFISLEVDGGAGDAIVSTGGPAMTETVRTDADGRYSLRGVTPDVELVVKAVGERIQPARSEPVTVRPDEVKRGVDFEASQGGSIAVEAALSDGSPARMCIVRATWAGDEDAGGDLEPQVSFIESGSTTLDGLRPGPWTVNVQRAGPGRDGSSGVEREVDVVAGETVPVTIPLN